MSTVRIQDLRAAGVCRDARFWFQKYGLDWKDFIKNGVDSELLLSKDPDHPAVQRVYESAKKRDP